MHSYKLRSQSRHAPSLQGSLRASAAFVSGSSGGPVSPLAEHLASAARALGTVNEDPTREPLPDDFEQISFDDIRASFYVGEFNSKPPPYPTALDTWPPRNSSFLARSRSSLSRLRKASRASRRKENPAADRKSSGSLEEPNDTALVLSVPPLSPLSDSFAATAPVDDTASIFYDSDPFRKIESPTEPPRSRPALRIVTQRPNTRPPPPKRPLPATPASSPQQLPLPSASSSQRSSNHWLNILARAKLFSSRNSAPQVQQIYRKENTDRLLRSSAPSPVDQSALPQAYHLPDLTFDHFDFSPALEPSPVSELTAQEFAPSDPPRVPKSQPLALVPRLRLQLPDYTCVDPRDLTVSPASAATAYSRFSLTNTPLPPGSPSWLSRNVVDLDPPQEPQTPILPIPPPSPAPLPILPRSLLPVITITTTDLDPPVDEDSDLQLTPNSAASSVTLCTSAQSLHASVRLFGRPRSRRTSSNRLSVVSFRRSFTENRKNSHSIYTFSPIDYSSNKSSPISAGTQDSSEPLHILFVKGLLPQTPQLTPLTPLSLSFDHPISSLPTQPEPAAPEASSGPAYQIFHPSPQAYTTSASEIFPIPTHLLAIAKTIYRASRSTAEMTTNFYGKQGETVDFGGEVDYSNYQWFSDPPPRPEQPTQPSATENYVPLPGVIEQNEMFDFALKSAPNVLYARFKQYGQLGVLAWCSEFSEMIDALKSLGFEGNMFVSTRTQALRTCEEILRLNLNIEMQIIVMYLSSQVARLRRFLDADRQWDDYPKPSFPLDPTQYT